MTAFLAILPLLVAASSVMVDVAVHERLSVQDEGPREGLTVALVPGLSGCAYGFRNLTPLLHDMGMRTVTIEPLGLGLSDRTKDADYTLTAQTARLAAVLDSLGITDAVFVSQGVATSMALRLVLARPDLVAGIVSVEGGAAESAATPTLTNGIKLGKMVAKLGGTRVIRDRYERDLRKASGDDSWVDRRVVRHYFRGANRDIQGSLDAFLAMSRQTEPVALQPRLPEVTVPVLVLLGSAEHGAALAPEDITVLAVGLPAVEFREVPGAGHFIYEEQPSTVAGAVADLVERIELRRHEPDVAETTHAISPAAAR